MMDVEELAELNALRFLVEALLARDLARVDGAEASRGAERLVALAKNATSTSDDEMALAVATATSGSIARLVERALERATYMRLSSWRPAHLPRARVGSGG